ncbi:MFS transporter [Companilactobacillus sp. HBUAS56275]|uniref:MFS transporter n=1 Tax=Companilactobacillus sp. HBUAS56275 TaxID=3109364 RepID=UPI002FF16A9A
MTLKKRLVILAMSITGFLVILDTNIMNITIPEIQSGLHVSLTNLSWAINIYTILFAAFLIPFGRIGDIFGHTKLLNIGLLIFGLGSIVSGASTTLNNLLIGRSIQSIGAAIMLPSGMILAFRQIEKEQRPKIVAILAATQALGAALGPTIGGFISQYFGWHWVFLINVPIVAIVLMITLVTLSMKDEPTKQIKIDLLGSIIIAITLILLTLALVEGRNWGWSSLGTISCLVSSLVLFVIFVIHETTTSEPLIPLSLFRQRNYIGSNVALLIAFIVMSSFIGIMPTFLTKVMGTSELHAALLITPMSVTLLIATPVATKLIEKISNRILIGFGITMLIISVFLLSRLNVESNWNQLYLIDVLLGLGIGFDAGPAMSIAVKNLDGPRLTAGQNILNVVRNIGVIVGIALFLSLLDGNINIAKKDTYNYSVSEIQKSELPSSLQKKFITKIHSRMSSNQISSSNGSNGFKIPRIDKSQTNQMIERTSNQSIKEKSSMMRVQLPTVVQQEIHKQVQIKVQDKVATMNVILKKLTKSIRLYLHNHLTDAFLKLYRFELPFVLISIFSIMIFERKESKGE